MKKIKLRCISEGAIMVAAATGLSFLKVVPVPYGGSIDLVMIPLVFFAVRWGLFWGLGAGLAYGAIDMIFSGAAAYVWQAIFLDYLLAYALVGTAGIMRNRKWGIVTGGLIGGFLRFAMHFISGVFVWREYFQEVFLSLNMPNIWIYSLLYNGVYMIPNIVLVVLFGIAASGSLMKFIEGADLEKIQSIPEKQISKSE